MTKDDYLQELNKVFKDFVFFPEDHHYEYKGNRVGISVTRLIEEYANEFNQEEIAKRVAIKEEKTIQEVLDEWEYKNKFACDKGSTSHEFAQSLWSKSMYADLLFDESEEYQNAVSKIKKQAQNFYDDYKLVLEHIADEFVIGSEEYDIASAVDHLFRNRHTNGLILVDYKTNSYLTGYNKKSYKKSMKSPLKHFNDDSLHHYYIQLSIYKYIIEKYTNLTIEEMFIVYMSENIENYEIIEIPYLKDEVELILEWRKWE